MCEYGRVDPVDSVAGQFTGKLNRKKGEQPQLALSAGRQMARQMNRSSIRCVSNAAVGGELVAAKLAARAAGPPPPTPSTRTHLVAI
jgi:hypothetical protein